MPSTADSQAVAGPRSPIATTSRAATAAVTPSRRTAARTVNPLRCSREHIGRPTNPVAPVTSIRVVAKSGIPCLISGPRGDGAGHRLDCPFNRAKHAWDDGGLRELVGDDHLGIRTARSAGGRLLDVCDDTVGFAMTCKEGPRAVRLIGREVSDVAGRRSDVEKREPELQDVVYLARSE